MQHQHHLLYEVPVEDSGGPPLRRRLREAGHGLAAAAAVLSLGAATIMVGMQTSKYDTNALLSWSNAADDGAGVLGGQQHGVSMIIHTCDADDPACTFQTSRKGYAQGQWVSNLKTKNERRMEVHVRSDLRQGSSYEDDIGEGPLAGMHKTNEKGKFAEWTPRPGPFREREYSRVKVGVADADGMDSWEGWRKDHPYRKGHGNLALFPYKSPTTDAAVLFKGPLRQPAATAQSDAARMQKRDGVDRNYDFHSIGKASAVASQQVHASGSGSQPSSTTHDAQTPLVRDGVEYVPVHRASRTFPTSAGPLDAVDVKDAHLLKALHTVVDIMHSTEAENAMLERKFDVLRMSRRKAELKAAAAQDRLRALASEEIRILGALDGPTPHEFSHGQASSKVEDATSDRPLSQAIDLGDSEADSAPKVEDDVAPALVDPLDGKSDHDPTKGESQEVTDERDEEEDMTDEEKADDPEVEPSVVASQADTAQQTAPVEGDEGVDDVESAIGGAVGNVAGFFEGEPRPRVDDASAN